MKYLNALNIILYYHVNQFKNLLRHFQNPKKAWEEANSEILQKIGWKEKLIRSFLEMKNLINVEKEWEALAKLGIKTLDTVALPILLQEIYDPPVILYCQGNLDLLHGQCLSMVGSRNISAYGKEVVKHFTKTFGQAGIVMVSGFAYGVDVTVHKHCLDGNYKTIAVLASGLNRKYPNYPQYFINKMISQGLFISEYPLNIESMSFHFPIRNRIISGLSSATIVIEAQEKSGSLITAKSAINQNRDVFSVPGSIFNSQSQGANLLIQKGEAELLLNANQILEKQLYHQPINRISNLGKLKTITKQNPPQLDNDDEIRIYKLLSPQNLLFDEILNFLKLDPSKLNQILSRMEINGIVKNLGGGIYGL